jgi:hypothetical protein
VSFIVANKRSATHQGIIRYRRELPYSRMPDGSFEVEEDFSEAYFSGFPSDNLMYSLVPEGWEVIEHRVMVVPQDNWGQDTDDLYWGAPDPLTGLVEDLEEIL